MLVLLLVCAGDDESRRVSSGVFLAVKTRKKALHEQTSMWKRLPLSVRCRGCHCLSLHYTPVSAMVVPASTSRVED